MKFARSAPVSDDSIGRLNKDQFRKAYDEGDNAVNKINYQVGSEDRAAYLMLMHWQEAVPGCDLASAMESARLASPKPGADISCEPGPSAAQKNLLAHLRKQLGGPDAAAKEGPDALLYGVSFRGHACVFVQDMSGGESHGLQVPTSMSRDDTRAFIDAMVDVLVGQPAASDPAIREQMKSVKEKYRI